MHIAYISFDDINIVISFDMINLWEKYVKKSPEDWLAYFAIITHENGLCCELMTPTFGDIKISDFDDKSIWLRSYSQWKQVTWWYGPEDQSIFGNINKMQNK